jgi:carboxyl-terminal processing protease
LAPLLGATLLGVGIGAGVTAKAIPAWAASAKESPYDVVRQLARVLVLVENEYVEPVDRAKLLRGGVKGMVSELDAHSEYFTPEEWADFKDESKRQFAGVGIEVDLKGDALIVLAPIEGSPAERAGIKSGDHIVAINGEPVVEVSVEKTIKRIKGPVGSHVKLTIRRANVPSALTFDLVREIVRLPSIRAKLLVGGIGYISLNQFIEGTHGELLRASAALRKAVGGELNGLILDLRNNGGGMVDEAVNVADELLDRGAIYSTRHRGVVVEEARASRGGALATVPLVVLVNDWSASASELLAGALQDDKRALIVGSQTFGKGSVQAIVELPDGAGLKLTISRYYTPLGRSIQAVGIQPDVVIASKLNEPEGAGKLHERDMLNHLPGEGGGRQRPDGGVITAPEDAGLEPADFRKMPHDPRGGPDYGLEVAYDVLTKQLVGHGPWVGGKEPN